VFAGEVVLGFVCHVTASCLVFWRDALRRPRATVWTWRDDLRVVRGPDGAGPSSDAIRSYWKSAESDRLGYGVGFVLFEYR
jgi:hypothetical protein